jgi:hypothetical protein
VPNLYLDSIAAFLAENTIVAEENRLQNFTFSVLAIRKGE